MTEQRKKLKVAVFGAGGIGKEVVQQLYEDYPIDDIEIVLVNRSKETLDLAIEEISRNLDDGRELPDNMDTEVSKHIRASWAKPKKKAEPKITALLDNDDIRLKGALKGVDAVFVTSGAQRNASIGETRDSASFNNVNLIDRVADLTAECCPDAIISINTNASDVMGSEFCRVYKEKGLSADRVFALGGELDEARCRIVIAKKLNEEFALSVEPSQVDVRIYGQHGDRMVIDLDNATVDGKNIKDIVLERSGNLQLFFESIAKTTTSYGAATAKDYEVKAGKSRTAFVSPASAMIKMMECALNGGEMSAIAFNPYLGFATGHRIKVDGEKVSISKCPNELNGGWSLSNLAVISGIEALKEYQGFRDLAQSGLISKLSSLPEDEIGFRIKPGVQVQEGLIEFLTSLEWEVNVDNDAITMKKPLVPEKPTRSEKEKSELDSALFVALKQVFGGIQSPEISK